VNHTEERAWVQVWPSSIVIAALYGGLLGNAQPTSLDRGYRQMYNLQFEEAHRTFADWQLVHPEDPLGPTSDAAAYLFSEFDRLKILQSEFFTHDDHFTTDRRLAPDPALKRKFESAMEVASRLAAFDPPSTNAQFAAVLCHGLRSDYLALVEKRYGASFKEMKAAREGADQLLRSCPDCYDAWLAVGLENYLLSVKPLLFRWFLRLQGGQTDRAIGLEKLRLTAEKGRYLAPLARLMLAVAALRGQDIKRAKELLSGLAHEFPRNPLFTQELIRLAPNP
jgi:hypothetical protein